MTSLSGFEDAAREALLDKAEDRAEEAASKLKRDAESNFRGYASSRGYAIDHVWRDAILSAVQRRSNSVSVRVDWPPLTNLFEYGVDPHVIRGNPLLDFMWLAPPEGTRPPGAPEHIVATEVNWGSVTGGIDEARAIRNALDVMRADLGSI